MAPRPPPKRSGLDVKRPGLDDMTLLTKPTPQGIRDNLKERIEAECIYTYIGNVLVAANPFTWLKLYDASDAKRYMRQSRLDVPPHVFAVAEAAFRAMTEEEDSQCVIISGESGAGKTECSKHIQGYFALCSAGTGCAEVERVKKVFLESNPLLEAFGNAKTLRNNNSSRFGKYFELLFDRFGTPKGGVVTNYLLEKSRTVKPGQGNRNFHVFYQLVQGAPADERARLCLLNDASAYPSLASCTQVEGMDDTREFQDTMKAMADVGLDDATADLSLRVVAACLALGLLTFAPLSVGDAEGSQIKETAPLDAACVLLHLDATALKDALASRTLETMAPGGKTETYDVPLNPTQASLARDALVKSIYSKLFDQLVEQVNVALDPGVQGEDDEELLSIGVLDIYGFEIFDRNGFEQLSINFVNEKLQQIFIALTLKAEQEEYVREGIEWKEVKFFNNKVVCELIENKRPPGILLVLDDCCKRMHSRPGNQIDETFRNDVASSQQQHRHFRSSKEGFVVQHYAGDVAYDTRGFAESNRDELRNDLFEVLVASRDPFLTNLYEEDRRELCERQSRPGKRGGSVTAGRKIRDQCSELVAALMQCEPHYVRCVKSNDEKRSLYCDEERVAHQCKYLGLPENVRVRRAGFAYRTEYHRFLERFKTLSRATYPREWTGTDQNGAREIVKAAAKLGGVLSSLADGTETQFGRHKLFVKQPEVYAQLEKVREEKFAAYAAKISKAGRRAADLKESVLLSRDVSRRFTSIGKRRRASSVDRPYAGEYLHSDAARKGLIDAKKRAKDSSRVVFSDQQTVTQLVKGATGPVFEKRLVGVTRDWLYVLQDEGPGSMRRYVLKRRVRLDCIDALLVSTKADGVLVIGTGAPKEIPKAVTKKLVKAGAWEANNDVKECPVSGKKFGVFGARRHHCRASGKIYAAEACEQRQAFPDEGWFTPEQVRDDLYGLEPTDPMEDLVFHSERRSELAGVILRENATCRLVARDDVPLRRALHLARAPTAQLKFGAPDGVEHAPPSTTADGDALLLTSPPGVTDQQAQDRRDRTDARRAARDQRRAAGRAMRQERDAERDAARHEERRRLLREKKARKQAEREARARAAGAIIPARRTAKTRRHAAPVAAAAPIKARVTAAALVVQPRAAPFVQPRAAPAVQPRAAAPPPIPPRKGAPPPMRRAVTIPQAVLEGEYFWQGTDGEQRGPSTWPEYKRAHASGETNAELLVYAADVADEWKAVAEVPDLMKYVEAPDAPPPKPPKPVPQMLPVPAREPAYEVWDGDPDSIVAAAPEPAREATSPLTSKALDTHVATVVEAPTPAEVRSEVSDLTDNTPAPTPAPVVAQAPGGHKLKFKKRDGGEAGTFKIDIMAAVFGSCKCGKLKKDHAGSELKCPPCD